MISASIALSSILLVGFIAFLIGTAVGAAHEAGSWALCAMDPRTLNIYHRGDFYRVMHQHEFDSLVLRGRVGVGD